MSASVIAEQCCPSQIGTGCWNDGTNSGTWVSLRDADGVVTVIDPVTGDPVAQADVVECPPPNYQTSITTVNASATFTIPAANLVSWTVRDRNGGAQLSVNGTAVIMDSGEVIGSSSQDDAGILDDTVVIATGAGESARVIWTTLV